MRCQNCNQNDASVLFTEIVGTEKKVYHLCKACAEAQGKGSVKAFSLNALLKEGRESGRAEALPSCPDCGLGFEEFRKGGLFGCAACYQAFETELDRLFKRIHGFNRHKAETPAPRRPEDDGLKALEVRLKQAVSREAFEEAARLRDRIARLKAHCKEA